MLNQPLANKYRPKNFSELKGQNVLVKILSNAITSGKIAHAYLVTGIRGVGKTTTARIIAKTINCTNVAIKDGMPIPCEQCKNCISINNFNHPDIIEIDAASKTGVNDIREIIENVKYKASLGRYRIYIIDEMHMLSNSAFNALLKTLEEPPENVLFIFATTEAQKIPATIISRCQRFDLLRLSSEQISNHIAEISQKEDIKYTKEGLDLIAKFSEGSVRDSLSLLETINLYKEPTQEISALLVNEVLGVPKSDALYKLINYIAVGNTQEALSVLNDMYRDGTELSLVMEELLHICNNISKSLVIKNFIEEGEIFDHEKPFLQEIKTKLDIISITNIWKMLFNGLGELKTSNYPLNVCEMVIIRACHLSNLPSLDSVIKKITTNTTHVTSSSTSSPALQTEKKTLDSFQDLVNLFYRKKELILYKQLTEHIQIISYKHGSIEAKTTGQIPENFTKNIITNLNNWTNDKWNFTLSNQENHAKVQKTIKEQELEMINNNELVKSICSNFPGTNITKIVKIKTN